MLAGWLLGLFLGVRHALEPDHIAAVSTLLARRRGPGGAVLLGAWWGTGHALALVAMATLLLAFRSSLPPRLGDAFELLVALMLIVLGLRALHDALRTGPVGMPGVHRHGHGPAHHHAGAPDHVHVGGLTLARRPLFVGIIHGLAGSGALTTLVLGKAPSATAGLVRVAGFGLGALMGMALLTFVLGFPMARLSRDPRFQPLLVGGTGVFSLALGAWFGLPLTLRLLVP